MVNRATQLEYRTNFSTKAWGSQTSSMHAETFTVVLLKYVGSLQGQTWNPASQKHRDAALCDTQTPHHRYAQV